MFTTVEPPPGLELVGRGCLLQAKVLRLKKDLKGENNAKEISDGLPFIEYELHRQLINKLKVKGMNGLFGVTTKLSVSDRTIVATATATAAYIAALPQSGRPRLAMTSSSEHEHQRLLLMQQRLEEKVSSVNRKRRYFLIVKISTRQFSWFSGVNSYPGFFSTLL